ncbi:hypothetical protein EP61_02030, partial [Listeria monocytogenes]|nr:hypothetical protein [Listeria monocytogenes]EAE1325505.1 hypothetical protein [Listeria monocytogenes]
SVIEMVSKKETNLVLHYTNFYVENDNFQEHLKMLQIELPKYDSNIRAKLCFSIEEIQFLKELCIEANCIQDLYKLGIHIYSSSFNYDEANRTFNRWIDPFISQMTVESIELLNDLVSNNPQCYERNRAALNHQLVVQKYDELGGKNTIATLRN